MEAIETLITAIRVATAADATEGARTTGAQACRTLLAALEAKPGVPLAHVPAAATPTGVIGAVVGALRNVPPEQLLDLAIAKLKAALPAGTELPAVQSVRIPLLSIANTEGAP